MCHEAKFYSSALHCAAQSTRSSSSVIFAVAHFSTFCFGFCVFYLLIVVVVVVIVVHM